MARRFRWTLTLCAMAVLAAAAAQAADPEPLWNLDLGLSYVATSGNSDTSTAGLTVDYTRRFPQWKVGAFLKAINASQDGEDTAERYAAGARTGYVLTDRLSIAGGLSGEKDRFAGFDLRAIVDAGVEYALVRSAELGVTGLASLAWTREEPSAGRSESWLGAIAGVKAAWAISPTAKATGDAFLYPSFEDSENWRGEAALGVEAALNRLLSLKASWAYRYDHDPQPGFRSTDTVTMISLALATASTSTL